MKNSPGVSLAKMILYRLPLVVAEQLGEPFMLDQLEQLGDEKSCSSYVERQLSRLISRPSILLWLLDVNDTVYTLSSSTLSLPDTFEMEQLLMLGSAHAKFDIKASRATSQKRD